MRFDTRKNYERKKRAERVVVNPELKISLPLSIYLSNAVRLRLHVSVFRDTEVKRVKMPLRLHVAHAFVYRHLHQAS